MEPVAFETLELGYHPPHQALHHVLDGGLPGAPTQPVAGSIDYGVLAVQVLELQVTSNLGLLVAWFNDDTLDRRLGGVSAEVL